MRETETERAFRFHLQGGPGHMHPGRIFNPMLIFPDQCGCIIKAQVDMHEEEKKMKAEQCKREALENTEFNRLFDQREV